MTLIESNRFTLRTWQLDDAKEAFKFYGDDEVSKYIGSSKSLKNIEQVEATLKKFINHEAEVGFSPRAIVSKTSNEIVGICGLHKFNLMKENELGSVSYTHLTLPTKA